MPIRIDSHGRVTASRSFVLPLSARQVWGQMRDFAAFIAIDPLHTRVQVAPLPPRRGADLVIPHRILGIGPTRTGRILTWDEGRGYAFSDLSRRGVRVGFPHVCAYRLEPLTERECRLTVSARGRWTARWVPRWCARLWLWWVLAATECHIAAYFARYRGWLARRPASGENTPVTGSRRRTCS